jgi:hypothetical protein
MGFFGALKRVLSREKHAEVSDEAKQRVRAAWRLDEEETTPEPAVPPPAPAHGVAATTTASTYDRSLWQKRLRRILDELPDSQRQWHDLMADAHVLRLEPDWIAQHQREEFVFLIRRAVSHRVVSEDDHKKLELARKLIGIPEAEAEETLHAIVAEAEAIFGTPIKNEA